MSPTRTNYLQAGPAISAREMRRGARHRAVASAALGCVALALVACASTPPLPDGTRADRILVEKSARRLTLLGGGAPLKSYTVALGRDPKGAKTREGDNRTPEGTYVIDGRHPDSAYHLALHISYPSSADRTRAAALGVPPGGDIMIHGIRNGFGWIGPLHRLADWTRGCIAVTDAEMEEIWRAVPDGTPVEIRP